MDRDRNTSSRPHVPCHLEPARSEEDGPQNQGQARWRPGAQTEDTLSPGFQRVLEGSWEGPPCDSRPPRRVSGASRAPEAYLLRQEAGSPASPLHILAVLWGVGWAAGAELSCCVERGAERSRLSRRRCWEVLSVGRSAASQPAASFKAQRPALSQSACSPAHQLLLPLQPGTGVRGERGPRWPPAEWWGCLCKADTVSESRPPSLLLSGSEFQERGFRALP